MPDNSDDFNSPKIIYPETTQGAYFTFDEGNYYVDKTCFMMISKTPLYLQSILSSKLYEYTYKRIFSSIELGPSGYQYHKHALIKLPVIKSDVDNSIDEVVIYKLYKLSDEEIKFISEQYS